MEGPRASTSGVALLKTLLLTDLVGSTRLIEELGDRRTFELIGRHDEMARRLIRECDGREIDKTDGFLILFDRPVDAVRYAMAYHRQLAALSQELGVVLAARAGIHLGEVYTRSNPAEEVARGAKALEVEGLAKPAAARIMSLAQGGQTLLTRGAFDLARRGAVDAELAGLELAWLDHGPYAFAGIEEPVGVFEVGEVGLAPLAPPPDSAKVQRVGKASERAEEQAPRQPVGPAAPVPGTRLGRYEIVAKLGSGGMGEVFRARDAELEREVAVKVLPSNVAEDPVRLQRFRREARAVARLSHPGVLEIFDFGTESGISYAVTELLDGEDLSRRLRRGPLQWREAVEIAAAVADALAVAHANGVVHRDLKPANIFCATDGRVKVLDFGLARLHQSASMTDTTRSIEPSPTTTGAIMGTPGYMAPEQVRGETADARSDVFALGAVLYEMLAGTRAFPGHSVGEALAAIIHVEPPSLEEVAADVPVELAAIVARCLAKRPEDRPPSADDVAAALRAVARKDDSGPTAQPKRPSVARRLTWTAVILAGVAVMASVWWPPKSAPTGTAKEETARVVVAPFDNRTGDASLDSLGEMAADWIAHGLARTGVTDVVPGVVALDAFRELREAPVGSPGGDRLKGLAEATGAGLVVSGTVFLLGDELRIHAEISDVIEDRLVLSLDPVNGPRTEPQAVLEELCDRVMGAIAYGRSTAIDPALLSKPPSFEAYREYLAGVSSFGGDDVASMGHFELAVGLDPDYVEPLIWIAAHQLRMGQFAQAATTAERLAQDRERLSPLEGHLADWLNAAIEGRNAEVLAAAREVYRLAPAWPSAMFITAQAAVAANRPQEAIDVLASHGKPRHQPKGFADYWGWSLAVIARHLTGDFEDELRMARVAAERFPDVLAFHGDEARALIALGRIDEALAIAERVLPMSGRDQPPGRVMLSVARELRVHGNHDRSVEMAQRAAQWFETRSPAGQPAELRRFRLAEAYRAAERWSEAEALWTEALAEDPNDTTALSRLGVLAARQGRRDEAVETSDRLAALDGRFLFGMHTLGRAQIAAVLGDTETAISLFRDALGQGATYGLEIHQEMAFESLREDPAFQELMRPKG